MEVGRDELGLLGAVTVVAVALFVCAPRFAGYVGREFARTHQAHIDAEFVAAFDHETVRRTRVLIVVLYPAVAWFVLLPVDVDTTTLALTLSPGALALAASAEGLWRVTRAGREFPVAPGRPGVARGRQPEVRDYVGPAPLAMLTLQALLGVAIAGGALRWAADDGWSGAAAGLLVSGVVILGLSLAAPLAWRVVVRRPQRAVDAAHLYFQDAWRADALRNTGILTVLVPLSAAYVWPESSDPARVALVVLALGIGALGLTDLAPPLRFRARLWPTLGPRQVLLPGEPVPPAA
ncbi:hypothetical protein [Pimelobacter simplex]|uniref:hypothetical protein n=1 Tax=Nocardioides simplex TaxID=2045 RepID=UPI00214FE7FA|nr:hypothetical protein [Pimelobacter simplex]UUW88233.1 hypothetical protein M0M43_21160 [Pimelobacter simplex]UUW97738.1 hypothetical protein M0M48_09805 [Pimelobacter simplex]